MRALHGRPKVGSTEVWPERKRSRLGFRRCPAGDTLSRNRRGPVDRETAPRDHNRRRTQRKIVEFRTRRAQFRDTSPLIKLRAAHGRPPPSTSYCKLPPDTPKANNNIPKARHRCTARATRARHNRHNPGLGAKYPTRWRQWACGGKRSRARYSAGGRVAEGTRCCAMILPV